jgi:hypothetical protein
VSLFIGGSSDVKANGGDGTVSTASGSNNTGDGGAGGGNGGSGIVYVRFKN